MMNVKLNLKKMKIKGKTPSKTKTIEEKKKTDAKLRETPKD